MTDYLLVFALVAGVNLLPAFGPPTWAVLVALRLSLGVPAVPLVLIGALAAASGRFALAVGSRHLRGRLSAERRAGLDELEQTLSSNRAAAVGGLSLFALSPLPSAQLFVAAGLTGVRLLPLTLAFFAGRLVSYSFYVAAASAADESLGGALGDFVTSPGGIVLQFAMVAALVALVRIDWTKVLHKARPGGRPTPRGTPTPAPGP